MSHNDPHALSKAYPSTSQKLRSSPSLSRFSLVVTVICMNVYIGLVSELYARAAESPGWIGKIVLMKVSDLCRGC